jgi:ABC-type multidrug transport system fused ATPase/permease subunit
LRFYNGYKGEIYINGKEIQGYSLKELRKMIALVPQEINLFHGTIEENIRYGLLEATSEEIIEACKEANCHQFIMELPEGYDTKLNENGSKLSGGQKQRLAIARALLMNRPILILDEATSALDSESEQQIKKALNRIRQGRTVLAIAHRFSTIKDADVIFVVDKGRAVEKGTNSELIEKAGIYKRLNEFQYKMEARV